MVFDKLGRFIGKGVRAAGGGGLEVIKWPEELDPAAIVAWRYPKEDIRLGSVLVVDESQKALFFRDGKLMGVLGPGRHVLDTQNVPFLHGLVSGLYGETIFKADVVFVNLLQYEGRFGDRAYIDWVGVHLLFNGTYYYVVDEERLETFYVRLLGRRSQLSVEDVRRTVNPMIVSTLVDALGEYATSQARAGRAVQNVTDFLALLNEFSDYVKARLAEKISEMFGISIQEVTLRIDISEEDKRILQMSGPRAYAAMYEREWKGRETVAKNLAQSPATGVAAPFIMYPWMMYPAMPPAPQQQPPMTPPAMPQPMPYPQMWGVPQQQAKYKCPYCGAEIPFLSPVCPVCARRIKWCPDGRPVREEDQCPPPPTPSGYPGFGGPPPSGRP